MAAPDFESVFAEQDLFAPSPTGEMDFNFYPFEDYSAVQGQAENNNSYWDDLFDWARQDAAAEAPAASPVAETEAITPQRGRKRRRSSTPLPPLRSSPAPSEPDEDAAAEAPAAGPVAADRPAGKRRPVAAGPAKVEGPDYGPNWWKSAPQDKEFRQQTEAELKEIMSQIWDQALRVKQPHTRTQRERDIADEIYGTPDTCNAERPTWRAERRYQTTPTQHPLGTPTNCFVTLHTCCHPPPWTYSVPSTYNLPDDTSCTVHTITYGMSYRSRKVISTVAALLIFLALYFHSRASTSLPLFGHEGRFGSANSKLPFYPGTAKPPGSNYSRILVVPRMQSEHVGWISKDLPGLAAAIYEVDNPAAEFRVPRNKGHEAMVYLTYIIDHYDRLPDTIIFAHAHQNAWHNNVLLGLDTSLAIKRLRDDRVARQGYMNLRCHHDPGCPDWIHLGRAEVDFDQRIKPEERRFNFDIFQALFPGHRPPPVLSQPCCAQFAVSGERVRDNPKSLYKHLRRWLLATDLEDRDSGRIFEYVWQYVFTRNAEHCPAMNACYCDGYGICFGGAKKLDDWMQKLRQREGVEIELRAAVKDGKARETVDAIAMKVYHLNRELNKEKDEAYRRGDDEANRAVERERLPQQRSQ
ncbi:hypothetical protein BDV95DRAFT_598213 [Massariosphaeria phaeospora]|uniref:Uncharacterized protein n=1 Tax=Massariosphaeria phaeospora TaxID=100035 RepID=A0A7C8I077_9PLEO|nr:hypothetical protein BDV95DRAFT_598213 [Massariosphaeria phaeospora]